MKASILRSGYAEITPKWEPNVASPEEVEAMRRLVWETFEPGTAIHYCGHHMSIVYCRFECHFMCVQLRYAPEGGYMETVDLTFPEALGLARSMRDIEPPSKEAEHKSNYATLAP